MISTKDKLKQLANGIKEFHEHSPGFFPAQILFWSMVIFFEFMGLGMT